MRRSLSDKAYELIKTEILTCVFEPGQQIVQQQLAERYGLGMTPVREALQRLGQEGFVQPVPRFGYTVRYVSLCDVHELYELRLILEPAVARLAATRATAEQLEAIDHFAGQTPPYDRGGIHVHNTAFHRALAESCGNRRLQENTCRMLDELTRVFYLGLDLSDPFPELQAAHSGVADAVCRHDPDRAEQLMESQILQSRQFVLEALVQRYALLGQAMPLSTISSP